MHLVFFSTFYQLISLFLTTIEHQSYLYSKIQPEPNWRSHEASSSTNYYCGQQDKLYYQPATYNQRQQYCYDRTTK